jgi:hypothetical protein
MNALQRHRAPSFLLPLVLLAMASAPLTLPAQSASSSKGSSGGSAVPGEGATGFSIETEMLTYRALESNGEAIACDVASYLEGVKTSFQVQATGAVCAVPSASGPSTVGVVILPFDRTVFGDFLIWRSDMQTMAEFEQRAANACNTTAPDSTGTSTQPGSQSGPPRSRGLTAASVLGSLTPAGSAVSAATGVLGMFASDHAATPVGGTIEDQAFMNNVSRELRAINVSVLMPDVYTPYALTSIDPTRSPFVIALDRLLHTRDCLVNNKTPDDPDVKNIDGFLASLSASASSSGPAKPAANPASSTTSTAPGTTTTTTSAAAPAAPAPSRLESALMADGLAQRLGADPNTGKIPANAPHHLLLIKALESGGSVNKSTNIFGTKMSYSGGSVGTYALFNLNGDLECSGNVYDYAGTIPAKDFQKQLHAFVPDPNNEVIFQRGTCTQLQPH